MHSRQAARRAYLPHLPAAALGFIGLLAVGCGAGTDVPTSPAESRFAPSDTGTVHGQVLAQGRPTSLPRRFDYGPPIAGATVELGIWRGSAREFRDSAASAVALRMDDPRFRVVRRVLTSALGEYRFAGLPKTQVFAMRVRPPPQSHYGATYFESLFWLFRSSEMRLTVVLRPQPH